MMEAITALRHRNSLGYTIRSEGSPYEQGARIVWGRPKVGDPVSINAVERGGRCDLVCECGVSLIAKKGLERAHHFAHEAGTASRCEQAQQAAIGRFAMIVIAQGESFALPFPYRHKKPELEALGYDAAFGCVRLLVKAKGRRLLVYLAVRASQFRMLRTAHLAPGPASTIAVDLSPYRACPDIDIAHALRNDATRIWLHNSRYKDVAKPSSATPIGVPRMAYNGQQRMALPAPDREPWSSRYEGDEFMMWAWKWRIDEATAIISRHDSDEATRFANTRYEWLSGQTPEEYNDHYSDLVSKVTQWLRSLSHSLK